jgi:hypothetical protein
MHAPSTCEVSAPALQYGSSRTPVSSHPATQPSSLASSLAAATAVEPPPALLVGLEKRGWSLSHAGTMPPQGSGGFFWTSAGGEGWSADTTWAKVAAEGPVDGVGCWLQRRVGISGWLLVRLCLVAHSTWCGCEFLWWRPGLGALCSSASDGGSEVARIS